jgi:hypothetical protein
MRHLTHTSTPAGAPMRMVRGHLVEHFLLRAATTGTTWRCCTHGCVGGSAPGAANPPAVDRLAVPRPFCEGVAAPADHHRTSSQRGCHNNQGVTHVAH